MWYLTGDLHGEIPPFFPRPTAEDDKVIVLGDNGANFYWNGSKVDKAFKEQLNEFGYQWYMIKGNHDKRPETLEDIKIEYDENVNGIVYYQEQYPNIKYFQMYNDYTIDKKRILIMGGAYSIDKNYRIENNWPWFADEQMSEQEMEVCFEKYNEEKFDYILTHTCPFSFIPDEFGYNPRFDYGMEEFFDKMEKSISYDWWYFGHFHKDMDIKNHKATLLYEAVIPFGNKIEEEVKNV